MRIPAKAGTSNNNGSIFLNLSLKLTTISYRPVGIAVLVFIFNTINSEIGISFRKPLSLSSRTKHSNTPFTVSSPMVDLFVLADLVSSSSIKRFLLKGDETTLRISMRKIGGFQGLRET